MRYPVFLINLDRQPGRLRFMQQQLSALGVTPIRIPATNGRDPDERSRSCAASYAQLSPGEIGCFESHRRLWQRIVDEGIPAAFVIEDDVILASDFAELDFPEIDADIIKIDAGIGSLSWYGTLSKPVTEMRSLRRLLGTEFSTGCYFITAAGARKLLARSRKYIDPVDRFMFDQTSRAFWAMKVWKLVPAAARQQQDISVAASTLDEEIADSISGGRDKGIEISAGKDFWSQQRLRLHRVLHLDLRRFREERKRRNLEHFRRQELVEKTFIPFESPNTEHVDSARAIRQ